MTFILKPDQLDSVSKVRDAVRQGYKAILLQGATGSGKSVIASDIIHGALKKKTRFWFSVPRKDLIRQMADTFREFEIPHSYIAAGMSLNPHATGHIVSTETVKSRLDKLIAPRLALIDETHFGGAGLDGIIKWLKQPHIDPDTGEIYHTIIIGLSATPFKTSGQGLRCWYDVMICGPSVRWLMDNNRLSEYRGFAPSTVDLSRISMVAGEYNQAQLAEKMEQDRVLIGSSVEHYKTHSMGKLGVTFAVGRKHSEIMAQAYRDAGIPAMHVDGETPMEERAKIFKGYARREILQLCNADLLTFGFDISSASGIKNVCVQTLHDCQPTKSLPKQMQKWGRFLRYEGPGAAPHDCFDHGNNFKEHGYPDDDRNWSLEDQIKVKGGEKAMPVRLCPECFLSHRPSPRCPNCGFQYPIEENEIKQVDGQLTEIDRNNRKMEIAVEKKQKRMEVGQAKTFADLRGIAKDRGYHHKWIERQAAIKGIKS